VIGNSVLRRTFRPKGNEEAGDWRRMHNEELHNLHASPSVIRMIKSRRMRWAGHVARIGEINICMCVCTYIYTHTHTIFWLDNLKGRVHAEDPGVEGKIILERILGKYIGELWTEFIWLRIGTSGGLL
jgi:hypothetical protein